MLKGTSRGATSSNCHFQIKFKKQNLKSAWLFALILISLPPVTGLRILSVSGKVSINEYSLCVVNILCVPPCFILPHES